MIGHYFLPRNFIYIFLKGEAMIFANGPVINNPAIIGCKTSVANYGIASTTSLIIKKT